MEANAPTVSVAIPVYNGEAYLRECVDSVMQQTFADWELVIVDNCSTDSTAAICAEYAAKDARVRVHRATEFVDVQANYNRTLRATNPGSLYIKFLGSDDWMYPECLERMLGVAEANPAVGFVSSYCLENDTVTHDGFLAARQTVISGREALRRSLLGTTWITGSASSLLFRASALRKLDEYLDPAVWHGDTDAAYRLMLEHDVGFVHQVLTFTRVHKAGLTSFSHRVNSYLPQAVRMMLRYGPRVLERNEFRPAVRKLLLEYIEFLARQCVKPSRWRQEEYQRFHRYELSEMSKEPAADAEIKLYFAVARGLLRDVPPLNPRSVKISPSATAASEPATTPQAAPGKAGDAAAATL